MSEPISFETIQRQNADDKQYEVIIKFCKGIDDSMSALQVTYETIVKAQGYFGIAFGIVRSLGQVIRNYDLNLQRVIELDSSHRENYGEESPWLEFIKELETRKAELEELRKHFFNHMVRLEFETFDLVKGVHEDD